MYEILIERGAERDLRRLPDELYRRIVAEIRSLADEPRPVGCRKLKGSRSDWRIRVGDYRVVYGIDDSLCTVRLMRIRHRRDVYR